MMHMSNRERVESNDHLLTAILLSLPPRSIFRFLCISKRWNYTIKHPFFHERYITCRRHRRRLLAFLEKDEGVVLWCESKESRDNVVPTKTLFAPNDDHRDNIFRFKVPQKLGCFTNASQGLILCHRKYEDLYVFNPVTENWVMLPLPPSRSPTDRFLGDTPMGLMCKKKNKSNNLNSSLSISFIVVQPYVKDRRNQNVTNVLEIRTYSSERGTWAYSELTTTGHFRLSWRSPVVENGVFHWYTCNEPGWIALYDPNDGQNHLQLISRPPCLSETWCRRIVARSPSDDVLWFGDTIDTGTQFWMLPKGDGVGSGCYKRSTTIPFEEWVFMYDISSERIGDNCLVSSHNYYKLDAFVSWDPLVVLVRKNSGWYLVNVETMTYEKSRFNNSNVNNFNCLSPFFESSLLASYAL